MERLPIKPLHVAPLYTWNIYKFKDYTIQVILSLILSYFHPLHINCSHTNIIYTIHKHIFKTFIIILVIPVTCFSLTTAFINLLSFHHSFLLSFILIFYYFISLYTMIPMTYLRNHSHYYLTVSFSILLLNPWWGLTAGEVTVHTRYDNATTRYSERHKTRFQYGMGRFNQDARKADIKITDIEL